MLDINRFLYSTFAVGKLVTGERIFVDVLLLFPLIYRCLISVRVLIVFPKSAMSVYQSSQYEFTIAFQQVIYLISCSVVCVDPSTHLRLTSLSYLMRRLRVVKQRRA